MANGIRKTAGIIIRGLFYLAVCVVLSSCTHMRRHDGPPDFYVDETKIPNAVPKVEPMAKYGNMPSYVVFGKRYYTMRSSRNYEAVGVASWYGTLFHERKTSSGELYDMLGMTAAHKTLPLPTYVEVTNLQNHRQIIVKVNDRGPFESNRLIDLSYVAAKKLGMLPRGTAPVKIRAIDPSTWHKSNDFWLASNTSTTREASNTRDAYSEPVRTLKRTYTYYLQNPRVLGAIAAAKPVRRYAAAPVETVSADIGAPVVTATPSRSSARSTRLNAERMNIEQQLALAYNTSEVKHTPRHARLARHGKHRVILTARASRRTAAHAKMHGSQRLVYLQVGKFRDKSHAQQLQRRLVALLEAPVNVSRSASKHRFYHVRVGPIKDAGTAKKVSHKLKMLGLQ